MSLQKQNAHILTVKAARGGSNSRHERNRVRGTVIISSTVFAYFFSSIVVERLIKCQQLDISTLLTPAAGHLVCCYLSGCPEEVRDLVDCPVMLLLGTGVTSADIIMSVIMSVSQLS